MITINKLSKSYGTKRILDDVSFEIESNKITFIMGENGTGKTTLIKCLTEMEDYYGDITFDEKRVDVVRNEIFVLFDDCPFYGNLTGINNLQIFSERRKSKEEVKAIGEKYLSCDTLKSKVETYSNGQRKKLGIALIECLKPKYIILDEISNGLDYVSLKQLKKMLWNGQRMRRLS